MFPCLKWFVCYDSLSAIVELSLFPPRGPYIPHLPYSGACPCTVHSPTLPSSLSSYPGDCIMPVEQPWRPALSQRSHGLGDPSCPTAALSRARPVNSVRVVGFTLRLLMTVHITFYSCSESFFSNTW